MSNPQLATAMFARNDPSASSLAYHVKVGPPRDLCFLAAQARAFPSVTEKTIRR